MRLFGEIFKKMEGELFSRCVLVIGGEGYFEGVRAVGELSPSRVVLYFPHTGVEIEGEELSVGKYCDGDLLLCGKIRAYRVTEEI